jgi:NTE family protein
MKRRQFALTAAASLTLATCAGVIPARVEGPHAPRALAPRPLPGKGLAFVLGSGGPRGFAHVGVLKALEEAGLKPDLIVGASVGALVGALYAAGKSAAELERIVLATDIMDFVDISLMAGGVVIGEKLQNFVNTQVANRKIEDFPTPFAAITLDAATRQTVALNGGDAGAAVRASSAVEGRFLPVMIGERTFVDADRVMPLPVSWAHSLGAKKVLAVDVSAHEDKAPAGAERFRASDLRQRALIKKEAALADHVLHPDFGYWASVSLEYRRRCITLAYEETKQRLDSLRTL